MKIFKNLVILSLFTVVSCTGVQLHTKAAHVAVVDKREKFVCPGEPVIVVVIDTGMGWNGLGTDARLCNRGHKDFTSAQRFSSGFKTKDPVPLDEHGHGTSIVGIIDGELQSAGVPYCIVVLKYFEVNAEGRLNLQNSTNAIRYARQIHADYINYSGGGILRDMAEQEEISKFLDAGGKFVAAAGNEGVNIDFFHFYPASYDPRITVVGMHNQDGSISKISNYGKGISRWEIGLNVLTYGFYMSGTSQSTAVATGKLVIENEKKCDINKGISKTAQLGH